LLIFFIFIFIFWGVLFCRCTIYWNPFTPPLLVSSSTNRPWQFQGWEVASVHHLRFSVISASFSVNGFQSLFSMLKLPFSPLVDSKVSSFNSYSLKNPFTFKYKKLICLPFIQSQQLVIDTQKTKEIVLQSQQAVTAAW